MARLHNLASILFVAPLAAFVLMGCTSIGDGSDPDGNGDPPQNEPVISPSIAHTGFDGQATFEVPISTNLIQFDSGDVTWELDKPEIATIGSVRVPDGPGYSDFAWAMIETKQAGTATVTVTLGDRKLTADLIVAAYDSAKIAVGEARYNTAGEGARVSCASCHIDGIGAAHTPRELAFHDDAAILMAIKDGKYPSGQILNDGDHSWDLTSEEEEGIVPYLRSLAPSGF